MFEGYADHYDAEARLVILKALAGETDYRLTDSMLTTMLEAFAIKRGRGLCPQSVALASAPASARSS
jgi:hypothetical protein